MKNMAAHNYEDLLQVSNLAHTRLQRLNIILQCAIPVFDGLFAEPHNTAVSKLLFTCAHWHGLAKLRMHTDQTLTILDSETVRIGKELRAFANVTCAAFETRELRRETDARKRRQSKNPTVVAAGSGGGSLLKKFNLTTPKHHFIGDYADTIRQFGTTDSFSSEPVRFIYFPLFVPAIC